MITESADARHGDRMSLFRRRSPARPAVDIVDAPAAAGYRRHERIGSWLVCRAYLPGEHGLAARKALVTNVSYGGAAVIAPAPLVSPDGEVYLELTTPTDAQLLPCEIVAAATYPGIYQVHVQFRFASGRQQGFVRRLVDELNAETGGRDRAA